MAKIHTLKINNYRCIERFEQTFYDSNFVCLVGRGDSGKSTILEAISAVLSPKWNYNFNDTDFFNLNIDDPIEIEVTLYELPIELLSEQKFGLYKQVINPDNEIIDDLLIEELDGDKDALSIKLLVDKNLEPKWYIVNNREQQEDIEIRANDRAKLNVFIVSDYLDKHFSWSKGSPLYTLLKQLNVNIETDKIITEANRKAIESIKDSDSFNSFDGIIENIKMAATNLGLSSIELEAFIDFKNILVKEGSISLHNESIPFRLNGKGSKRLLSIAIQLELAKYGGIILIDEIEQGLEPDRAKFLAKYLKDNNHGQVYISTHSSNVIVELDFKNIFLKKSDADHLFAFNKDFKGCIRNNPEAFFAKNIIVCEGATEVGICRALNNFRIKNNEDNLAMLGIAIVDGTGDNFVNYCLKFKKAGFNVCAFCDSDKREIDDKKKHLIERGITLIDCDAGNSIEQQLFIDLPWRNVKRLLMYAITEKSEEGILAVTEKASLNELLENDTIGIRKLLGKKARKNGWYKRIDHGEKIGKLWFNSIPDLEGKTLNKEYEGLTKWIKG